MRKHILAYSILSCSVVVLGFSNKFISKGRWVVDKIERCSNPDSYPYDMTLHKKKVNRTHDGFYGEMEIMEDLTEDDFGILIEACKLVDGGCRHVAKFEDKSLCRFLVQYAEENFKEFLRNIGAEEHCPIPKGFYKMNDYLFDNREIADEGMVGNFMATTYVLKHDVKMSCLAIHIHFAESDVDE